MMNILFKIKNIHKIINKIIFKNKIILKINNKYNNHNYRQMMIIKKLFVI